MAGNNHRCPGARAGLAPASLEDPRKRSPTAAQLPAEGREPKTGQDRRCSQNDRAGTARLESMANRRDLRAGAGVGRCERPVVAAFRATSGFLTVGSAHEISGFRNPARAFAGWPHGCLYSRRIHFLRSGSNLRQNPSRWRATTTHARQPGQDESGVFSGWHAHRVYHRKPGFSMGHLDGPRTGWRAATDAQKRLWSDLDRSTADPVLRDTDGRPHGGGDFRREPHRPA